MCMHVVGRIRMFVSDGQLAPNQVVIDGAYRHSQTLATVTLRKLQRKSKLSTHMVSIEGSPAEVSHSANPCYHHTVSRQFLGGKG